MAASASVDEYLATECGWSVIPVLAKDYEFDADFTAAEGFVGFE